MLTNVHLLYIIYIAKSEKNYYTEELIMNGFMAVINSLYAFLVQLFKMIGIDLPPVFDPEIEPLD